MKCTCSYYCFLLDQMEDEVHNNGVKMCMIDLFKNLTKNEEV